MAKIRITQVRHPEYNLDLPNYEKWRLCYRAGDPFILRYLQKFSTRESEENFKLRLAATYAPAFAKAAIKEIRNSIYQRMSEIKRLGGVKNYVDSIAGFDGGVDLHGASMNAFMGQEVMTELMIMGKVGVIVDKPRIDNTRMDLNIDKRPYLYYYKREDILSWECQHIQGDEIFTNLLLRTHLLEYDEEYNLPIGYKEVYRHFWIDNEGVVNVDDWIDYLDENEHDASKKQKSKIISTVKLKLKEIPFVLMDIGESLMEDIANYQIALLNLASSDLNYAMRSNFVFYTEQVDPISDQAYLRKPTIPKVDPNNPLISREKLDEAQKGTQTLANTSQGAEERAAGALAGRKYNKGLDRPGFISPPSEPLKASMAKQEQMKIELRQIINLALSNISPQHASVESKKEDKSGLENGLSGIGLELEYGERRIAKLWAEYENSKERVEVNYPRKYDIKSDADRQTESKSLKELKGAAPSLTFAKEVGKEIARTMLSGKVKQETLITIENEIDKAEYVTSEAADIKIDVELGIVSKETASTARGYDGKKEVPIAKKEHTEELAQIAASQTPGLGAARGVGGNPGDADLEKDVSQNPTLNPGGSTRGPGK